MKMEVAMEQGYVYRFLGKNNEVLYIGKTKHLETRLMTHFGKNGHLRPKEYAQVHSVQYITFPSYNDAGIMEIVFIDYYCPPFNKAIK